MSRLWINFRRLIFCHVACFVLAAKGHSTNVQDSSKGSSNLENDDVKAVVFNHVYNIQVPRKTLFDLGNEDEKKLIKESAAFRAEHGTSKKISKLGKKIQVNHEFHVSPDSCCKDVKILRRENEKLMKRVNRMQRKMRRLKEKKRHKTNKLRGLRDVEEQAIPLTYLDCPNECSGNGACIGGDCHCNRGFKGKKCDLPTCPNACNNHGICMKNGQCACKEEWSGEDCSIKACPAGCNVNGDCVDGKCICYQGFRGNDCSQKSCPNQCSGRGKCDASFGFCKCRPKWTGKDCSLRRCANDCSDKGQCLNGSCQCDARFTGKSCNLPQCPNNCSGNGQCKNGTCICRRGWQSHDCGTASCIGDCSGNGVCLNGVCLCASGYSGPACETPLCPNHCSDHGSCIEEACKCLEGWEGKSCSEIIRPRDLIVRNIEPNAIDLKWTKTSIAITGNQVNCIPESGTANAVYKAVGPNITELTIRDLDTGTQYSVYVHAKMETQLSAPITASVKTAIGSPTELSWLRIGETFAEISWKPSDSAIDRYKLVCSCKEGGAEFNVPSTDNSIIINDLSPGATYTVSLYAVQGSDMSSPVMINFTTTIDAPKNIEIDEITENSALIRWSKSNAFVLGYKIVISRKAMDDQKEFYLSQLMPPNTLEYRVTGLASKTMYNVTLSSFTELQESKFIKLQLTTGFQPPHNLVVSEITESSVVLTWKETESERVDMFELLLTEVSDHEDISDTSAMESLVVRGNATQALFESLKPSTEYLVQVVSVAAGQKSTPVIKSFSTVLFDSIEIYLERSEANNITVSWTDANLHVKGYLIVYTDLITNETMKMQFPADRNNATISGLHPGRFYQVEISSYMDSSTPKILIVSTRLDAPTNLTATGLGPQTIQLTWNPSIAMEYLDIYYVTLCKLENSQDRMGNTFFLQDSKLSNVSAMVEFMIPKEKKLIVIYDLEPGTMYEASITAVALLDGIDSSHTTVVKTLTLPGKIKNVEFTSITASSAAISWQAPKGNLDGYVISYQDIDNLYPVQNKRIRSSKTSFQFKDLMDETEYTVEISTVLDGKIGPEFSTTFATRAKVIESEMYLQATDITSSTATLEWMPALDNTITEYFITYRPNLRVGELHNISLPKDASTVILTGLEPRTSYMINIHAMDGLMMSLPEQISIITELETPKYLQLDVVTDQIVVISWAQPALPVDQYHITHYKTLQADSREETSILGNSTFWTMENLESGEHYSLELSAKWNGFNSAPALLHFTTLPGIIEKFRSPKQGPDFINLAWRQIHKENSTCILEYWPTDDPFEEKRISISSKQNKYVMQNLTAGAEYIISIALEVNDDLRGDSVTIVVPTTVPAVNEILTSTYNSTAIYLSWNSDHIEMIDGYKISYRSHHDEDYSLYARVENEVTDIVVGQLQSNTKYFFLVQATKNEFESKPRKAEEVTDFPVLPPHNIRIIDADDTFAVIEWEDRNEDEAVGYIAHYWPVDEGPFRSQKVKVEGKSSLNISGLIPNTHYEIILAAFKENEVSSSSDAFVFETSPMLIAPANLKVIRVEESSIKIQWESVADNDTLEYKISCRPVDQDDYETIMMVDNSKRKYISAVITDLEPAMEYMINVQTCGNRAASRNSTVTITTLSQFSAPTDFLVAFQNETDLLLEWNHSGHAIDSFIIILRHAGSEEVEKYEIPSNNTWLLLHDLIPVTKYVASITAIRGRRTTKPVRLQFQTDLYILPPENLRCSLTESYSSVMIEWSSQPWPVDRFYVTYSTVDEKDIKTSQIEPDVTYLELNGLLPGMKYKLNISSVIGSNESEPTTLFFHTELDNPGYVHTALINQQTVDIMWNPAIAENITGYVVYLHKLEKDSLDGSFLKSYHVESDVNTLRITELSPDTTYRAGVVTLKGTESSRNSTALFKTDKLPYVEPRDCIEVLLNGNTENDVYSIHPDGMIPPIKVYCDLQSDGGGWTVIQRRMDGGLNFSRTWDDYVEGFGNYSGEFWLGFEMLRLLLISEKDTSHELRIDLRHGNESVYAVYEQFMVSNRKDEFTLTVDKYFGTAGDSMSYQSGMKFTTFDRDNDLATNRNCASQFGGGWWYNNCHRSNLNGIYGETSHSKGINWYSWKGFTNSISFVEMKFRPIRDTKTL